MGCLVSKRQDAYTTEKYADTAEASNNPSTEYGQEARASRSAPDLRSGANSSLGVKTIPGASSGRSDMSSNPYGSIGSNSGYGRNGQLHPSRSKKADHGIKSNSPGTCSTTASCCTIAHSYERDVVCEDQTQISDKDGQVVMRLPGSMRGGPLAVRNLHNCDIYVLDRTSQVLVDDCTGCTFLIGPVAGSAFIRDCSDCRFHVISQQLRLRGVISATLSLHCRTRPIIESCSALRFACWDWGHAALPAHLPAAALSPFHNFWSRVHDFTPPAAGGGWNWGYAEPHEAAPSAAGVLRHAVPPAVQDLVDAAVGRPTFVTHGERPLDECSAYLFVFLTPAGLAHAGVPPSDAGACAALTEIAEGYTLLRTNKAELTAEALEQMRCTAPHWAAQEPELQGAAGSTVWGFEIAGEANDAAERRAARYGASVSESLATAALFRELGMTG